MDENVVYHPTNVTTSLPFLKANPCEWLLGIRVFG